MALSIMIIPNENKLNIPVYHDQIESGRHRDMLSKFCELYNIDNVFESDDLNITYNGHITIEGVDSTSTVTTWIPDNITDKQYDEILNSKDTFSKYSNMAFRSWPSNAIDVDQVPSGYNGTVLDYFYEELENYHKGNKMHK